MSAINSNSSDRDLEAIHRAQRAHEPSMEEILASIRNIIADDPAKEAAPKRPQAPAPTPRRKSSIPRTPPRRTATPPDRPQRPDANAPTVVWRRPQAVEAESPPPTQASPAQRGAVAVARGERGGRPCRSGPCRPISMFAAPSSPTAWCATCCGRCSSSGWTRTCPPMVERLVRDGDPAGRARAEIGRPARVAR